MKAWRQVAAVWIFALGSSPAVAITINDFTAARNDRFVSGYPNGPVMPNTNPSFIGLGYDWSGVGWVQNNGNMCFGLITPRQMLIANHYQPGVGQNIQFASASGQVTTATVQSQPGTHSDSPTYASDMATARFSSAIPQSAGIVTYPILFQGYNPRTYAGYNLLSYGQTESIGWNKIDSVNTGTGYDWGGPFSPDSAYYMNFLYDTTTPDRTQLNGGDSGSPSFIVTGSPGVMYLAGGPLPDCGRVHAVGIRSSPSRCRPSIMTRCRPGTCPRSSRRPRPAGLAGLPALAIGVPGATGRAAPSPTTCSPAGK